MKKIFYLLSFLFMEINPTYIIFYKLLKLHIYKTMAHHFVAPSIRQIEMTED